MCGPYPTIADAVTGSGWQFGMGIMEITCSTSPEELRAILSDASFVLDNVSAFTINGVDVEDVSVDSIVRVYGSRSGAEALSDDPGREP